MTTRSKRSCTKAGLGRGARGWEASQQVGGQVAEWVPPAGAVRNAAARAQGFRDHFQRSLTLDEIDENELLSLFADLEFATRKPFQALKERIDGLRAAHFGIPRADLRPWHYGDRFFQEVPQLGDVDMDGLFEGKDLVALATATYDGLGLEVRDIVARSDPTPGRERTSTPSAFTSTRRRRAHAEQPGAQQALGFHDIARARPRRV